MTDPIPPRPYSKVKGSEPSVTTILGVKNTPGLDWAAAKLTAEHAVYSDEWQSPTRNPADEVDTLRRYFRGIWDGRAYMGTLVHKVMEGWAAGEIVDVKGLVEAHTMWTKTPDLLIDKRSAALMYLEGLEKWWTQYVPLNIVTEECIRTPGAYVGTRDMVCDIDGERWLLDLKTTEHAWNPKLTPAKQKGVYGDSWTLQLAAYRYATEVVTYGWMSGDKKPVLQVIETRPNTPVDRCGIIHLRGDGEFTFYEVEADESALETFMDLAKTHAWLKTVPTPTILGGRND